MKSLAIMFYYLVALITWLRIAAAAPGVNWNGPSTCRFNPEKTIILSADRVTGWTFPVSGSYCVAESADCGLQASESHAVTTSWTVGGSVDIGGPLKNFLTLGTTFSASYSYAEENARAFSVETRCPKHHTCGQQVTPQMLHVKGYKFNSCDKDVPEQYRRYFEVFYPVIFKGNSDATKALATWSSCTIGRPSKGYPQCPPEGGEPRPQVCDAIGAVDLKQERNKTCRF